MKKTSQEYWAKFEIVSNKKKTTDNHFLFDIFKRFLQENAEKSLIEIGCNPGGFLVAFKKAFNYKITGLDYNDTTITKKNFEKNNITEYELIQDDFFKFEPKNKYNIVSSFGFIEHFDDVEPVIDKMIKHLKKNGLLIFGIPNRKYLNYYLHLITYGKKVLYTHNLDIMDLGKIENIMSEKMERIYTGYYNGFKYKMSRKSKLKTIISIPVLFGSRMIDRNKLLQNLNFTSKYYSPYIIYIGKRI